MLPVVGAINVVFEPDSARLITGSSRSRIQVWNAEFEPLTVDFQGWLGGLAASRNRVEVQQAIESKLPSAESFHPKVAVTRDGRLRAVVSIEDRPQEPDQTSGSDAPNRNSGNKVEDTQTLEVLHNFAGMSDHMSVAVSADGRFAATGAWDRDNSTGVIRLWDLSSGAKLREIMGHVHYVNALAFSPDGSQLLSGGKGTMPLYAGHAVRPRSPQDAGSSGFRESGHFFARWPARRGVAKQPLGREVGQHHVRCAKRRRSPGLWRVLSRKIAFMRVHV